MCPLWTVWKTLGWCVFMTCVTDCIILRSDPAIRSISPGFLLGGLRRMGRSLTYVYRCRRRVCETLWITQGLGRLRSGGLLSEERGIAERWEAVLTTLKGRMTEQRFTTWFRPIEPRRLDRENLTLEVPNPFFIDWFEEHNLPILREAVHESLGLGSEDQVHGSRGLPRAVPAKSREGRDSVVVRLPGAIEAPGGTANLNPRFSFDNFVVGRSNELAHAACQAVAKDPGHVYNPLFIYGGVGLGKTHLMQAIGIAVRARNPGGPSPLCRAPRPS